MMPGSVAAVGVNWRRWRGPPQDHGVPAAPEQCVSRRPVTLLPRASLQAHPEPHLEPQTSWGSPSEANVVTVFTSVCLELRVHLEYLGPLGDVALWSFTSSGW